MHQASRQTSAWVGTRIEELARAVKVPRERGRAPGQRGRIRQAQCGQPALQRRQSVTVITCTRCASAKSKPSLARAKARTPSCSAAAAQSGASSNPDGDGLPNFAVGPTRGDACQHSSASHAHAELVALAVSWGSHRRSSGSADSCPGGGGGAGAPAPSESAARCADACRRCVNR